MDGAGGLASVETNFGRSTAVGVRDGVNFAGCCAGPMQFNIRNGPPSTWERFRVDGNGDGRTDVYDPADAVPAAARLLKQAGAPGDLRRALLAYNNAGWYVDRVLAQARAYAEGGMALVGPASAGVACAAEDAAGLLEGGQTGAWTLAPGANRPGVALTPLMRRFVDRMAGLVPGIVVTTGTNHSQFSSSGNVSDHWDGNGVDFGSVANGFPATGGGRGDLIAAAALVVAGRSPARALAEARRGGAITVTRPGLRVQVIWKSLVGGNHFNHVHVGLRPT